jgi:phage tail-like protein
VGPQAPEHFLVVDDDAVIRRAVGRGAQGLMEARYAESGVEALDLLGRSPLPRFVLLDYMLPDLNGLQVLRQLRADARCADLPVVMFSSIQDPRRIQETLDAGADGWVAKPDDPEQLRKTVRALCAEWGGVQAPAPAPGRQARSDGAAVDPYQGMRFRILWAGRCVAAAQECGQLARVTEARDNPGTGTGPVHRSPGRTRYLPLLLNDVVTEDEAFDGWAAADPGITPARRDLTIEVRDGNGVLLRAYRLTRCWPSSYEGSPLGARPIRIHSLRLEHEGWIRDGGPVPPARE